MPGRVGAVEVLRRALLALLAVTVLLLPLPLGDQVADAGATCCGEVARAADACCDDCGAPTVSEDDDAAHHPCCVDGCHCACCGRLPLELAGAGASLAPTLRGLVEARPPRAPAADVSFAIFDPPRA